MQPYSNKKSHAATCKCRYCKAHRTKLRGGTDPTRRALKKGARQAGKLEL